MKENLLKIFLILSIAIFSSAEGYVGELPKLEGPVMTLPPLEQPAEKEKPPEPKNEDTSVHPLAPKNYGDIYSKTMLKQGKYTKYLKEVEDIIPILEKLTTIIQNKDNIQVFCANSNILNLYVTDLEKKYKNKPESHYESYKQIIKTNKTVLEVANHWRDTRKYKRVRWNSSGTRISDQEFMNIKLNSALNAINKALEVLKDI